MRASTRSALAIDETGSLCSGALMRCIQVCSKGGDTMLLLCTSAAAWLEGTSTGAFADEMTSWVERRRL